MKERKKNGNIHPTRIFKIPSEMETAWQEYKVDIKEQEKEWVKVHYVGREGARKADPQKVPYTLAGFKRFCREHYGDVEQYFKNTGNYYGDFVPICNAIKEEIRENQIIGGMLGFYSASITQRLTGLTDKTETKAEGEIIISFKD